MIHVKRTCKNGRRKDGRCRKRRLKGMAVASRKTPRRKSNRTFVTVGSVAIVGGLAYLVTRR
jgi:hypothetical protein